MGLISSLLFFQEKIIKKAGFQWEKIRICELGSQIIENRNIPAKKFYLEEKKVLEHISLDLNGTYGSLKVDLCRPIPKRLLNRFNLITNYGTTEHVNNQYQVFKNIHDMCRLNGIIIHTLPVENHWVNHCRYYYSQFFFMELAKLCNYKILQIEIKNAYNPPRPKKNLIYVALFKQNNNDYILKKIFKTLKIFDSKNITHTGNYTKKKIWLLLWDHFVNKIPGKYLKRILRTIQCFLLESFVNRTQ